jgi:hypothetical protein
VPIEGVRSELSFDRQQSRDADLEAPPKSGLVDGQPLDDVAILQDPARVALVMRDGVVRKRLGPSA